MIYLLGFIAMAGLDFLYAEYTKATADRRILHASGAAAMLILLQGFVTTSYVSDHWVLIPVSAGAFLGTWLSIKFGK